MEELIEILKLPDEQLKLILYGYLKDRMYSPVYGDGYLYAAGEIPVLLVAHMDTVLKEPPRTVIYEKEEDILYGKRGIGGDDRCGIYAILQLLDEFRPHVLFTEDEEIGCIGARKATRELQKPDVKFIIEVDRKGNNDCVFYDCGNYEFQDFIKSFGFKTQYGSVSDICVLSKAWDLAAVNISTGYYEQHTYREYIKYSELLNIIDRIKVILSLNYKEIESYDYQEVKYTYPYNYRNANGYGYGYYDNQGTYGYDQYWDYHDSPYLTDKDKVFLDNWLKENYGTTRNSRTLNNRSGMNNHGDR